MGCFFVGVEVVSKSILRTQKYGQQKLTYGYQEWSEMALGIQASKGDVDSANSCEQRSKIEERNNGLPMTAEFKLY